MIKVNIGDGGNGKNAGVTHRQQLIVSPIEYSKTHAASLSVDDTAFNLVVPIANKKFVITDLILTGDKNISTTTDAVVEIYEADTEDATAVSNTLGIFQVARSSSLALTGLNVITQDVSKFINGKTSDNNVSVVLYGYYVIE